MIGTASRLEKSKLAIHFRGATRRPARRPAGEAESVSSSGEAAYMGGFGRRQQRFCSFFGSTSFSIVTALPKVVSIDTFPLRRRRVIRVHPRAIDVRPHERI